jgi:hypothetical protein
VSHFLSLIRPQHSRERPALAADQTYRKNLQQPLTNRSEADPRAPDFNRLPVRDRWPVKRTFG